MEKKKIDVKLLGEDGNAYFILGKVEQELKRNGYTKEEIGDYYKQATLGSYHHLLSVTSEWVNIV